MEHFNLSKVREQSNSEKIKSLVNLTVLHNSKEEFPINITFYNEHAMAWEKFI